jgi:hypothetical protein
MYKIVILKMYFRLFSFNVSRRRTRYQITCSSRKNFFRVMCIYMFYEMICLKYEKLFDLSGFYKYREYRFIIIKVKQVSSE